MVDDVSPWCAWPDVCAVDDDCIVVHTELTVQPSAVAHHHYHNKLRIVNKIKQNKKFCVVLSCLFDKQKNQKKDLIGRMLNIQL